MDVTIACVCGGDRHPDGDTITFAEKLTSRQAGTMMHAVSVYQTDYAIAQDGDEKTPPPLEEVLTVLTEAYVKYGVTAWTLEDERGPIPVTPANVDRYVVQDMAAFLVVGDVADGLYSEAILVPLMARALRSSADTPTTDSTSVLPGSPPEPEVSTPSKPYSISTTPTDDTATTGPSPDGDYKSSQSLASVG